MGSSPSAGTRSRLESRSLGILKHSARLAPLLFCGAVACSSDAGAAPALYRFAPPAQWITPAQPEYQPANVPADVGGTWFLLFDRQIDVNARGDDYYEHMAVKVLNAAGVDEESQINVAVDPAFQSLDFHALRIVRDGRVIDQSHARITVLPQETELRNRIYNGTFNINVLLKDVRIGDVVEYAYTIHEQEKLFPGHFSTRLGIFWSTPVHWQRIRLRWPLDRALHFRRTDNQPLPAPRDLGNARELVLEQKDLAAIPSDTDRPDWYITWNYLEASDLTSWGDVVHRVVPLYARPLPGDARLSAVVHDIGAAGGSAEAQTLRALQYVQDEIRYVSVAIGPGTHQPTDPETVLERRFGDCKDKSLLLATVLNRLGIDAHPALVHTRHGRNLSAALPTPYAFDHVIVRAQIDGKVYWLDGTRPRQYSPLATNLTADFERALLIDNTSSGLVAIPRPAPDARRREIDMTFDLGKGIESGATLELTTRYFGTVADGMRSALANDSPEQRKTDYANYIAKYYPSAKPAGPITIEDDKAANLLTVREHYKLARTFDKDEDGDRTFYMHADELYKYGEALTSSVRHAPLEIEYPVRVRQHIVALLPEDWTVEPATVTVENPAFRYRGEVAYRARRLELTYDYEALSDEVPLAALEQYKADRKRFYDDLGYQLTYQQPGAATQRAGVAPWPVLVFLGSLALGVWAAIRRGYRYDPEPPPSTGSPIGIRGWLLLPALGVILGPVFSVEVIAAWAWIVEPDRWYALPDYAVGSYRGVIQPVALGLIALQGVLLVAQLFLAVLFFKKRSSAPKAFIAMIWFAALLDIMIAVGAVLFGVDRETSPARLTAEMVPGLFANFIWTAYMLVSQRVRATFVQRLPGVQALPAIATS